MIVWSLVLERLKVYISSYLNMPIDIIKSTVDLEVVLRFLYQNCKMSLRQISDLTKGECTGNSILRKLNEFNIPLRKRGGANNTKPFTISKEEYDTMTYKELAFKYKVSLYTICRRCREFIDKGGKKRPKGWKERVK